MTLFKKNTTEAAKWNQFDNSDSPAGALFIGGAHAEADIVGRTGTGSGRCGTICTGSTIFQCC